MRLAARVDGTHAPIVKALRSRGWSVLSLAPLGYGAPDLLVARQDGLTGLLEVKSKGGRVTQIQREWHAQWHGPVNVVHNEDEAIAAVEGWAA